MFHIIELEQHLVEVLQTNEDEHEGEELLENLPMTPIEPARKQDCPSFHQVSILRSRGRATIPSVIVISYFVRRTWTHGIC